MFCANGNQPEFTFTLMMRKIKNGLWYNFVSQVKFSFVMFVSNAFAHLLIRNLNSFD